MEKPIIQATVVFLVDDKGRICLARKKQPIHHDNGEISYSLGLYNGYGGKREAEDASISHTAVRELFDESSVKVHREDLELAARIYFYVLDKNTEEHKPFMDVFFFFARTWQGVPEEGPEMGGPEYFSQHELPYGEMMPADRELLQRIFVGERKVYQVKLWGKSTSPEVVVLPEELEIA